MISARKARLQQAADDGNVGAAAALKISNSPGNFLSTVQIAITLIGILQGAVAGNTIAAAIADLINNTIVLAPYAETISVGIVVLGVTFLSLVLGELVPKNIALNNPERVASTVASPMGMLTRLTYPGVLVLSKTVNAVLRILRIKPSDEPSVTEEEVRVMIAQGTQAGTFHASEQEMIEQVLRLGDRRVSALMTPRRDIVWLDTSHSSAAIQSQIVGSPFSFFPVAQDSLENLLGVVRGKDVLAQIIQSQNCDLTACLRKPLYVPETTLALSTLDMFRANGNHIAFVMDEYGVTQGLITFNDILQSVFGEVPMADSAEPAMVIRRDDGSWLMDGLLQLDELAEVLEARDLTAAERSNSQTLGGFVMSQLGAVPVTGQYFEWEGFRFEVIDMDERRVDKVLVTKTQRA